MAQPPPQNFATNAPGNGAAEGARQPDDIDELIRMAEAGIKPPRKSETPATPGAAPSGVVEPTHTPAGEEKKGRKDKEKATKMAYADNEVSPEEKMARLPRYAFVPEKKDDSVLVDATLAPPVTGVGRDQDDVISR